MPAIPSRHSDGGLSAEGSMSSAGNSSDSDIGGVPDVYSDSSMFSVGDSDDHPAMVWDKKKSGKMPGLSTMDATLSLITAIVGAGIMALPQLPKSGGMIPCVALMLVSAFAIQESASAYWKAWMAWNDHKPKDDKIHTFEDFGRAAAGNVGANMVQVSLILMILGLCSGYVILMTDQLMALTDQTVARTTLMLGLSPILWILCMMRDLSAVAKLMPLGVLGAFGSCILIIGASGSDMSNWEGWSQADQDRLHSNWPKDPSAIGPIVATLFGAFAVMANLPVVLDEMKKPKRLAKSLKSAMLVVTSMYMGVMIMGYCAYGNVIRSNIGESIIQLPRNATEAFEVPYKDWSGQRNSFLPKILAGCVFVNLFLSYPLCMMSVYTSVQGVPKCGKMLAPGTCANYLMRTSTVVFTHVVGLLIADFSIVFALFASVCAPLLSAFFPIIFGHIIRRKVGARPAGPVRKVLHVMILLLSTYCTVFGFYGSVVNLIASFKE